MSLDIQARLHYNDDSNGQRPYFFMRPQTSQEKQLFGGKMIDDTIKGVDKTVKDGRGKQLKLDEHSFCLTNQTTALSTQDFYKNEKKIKEVYYPEIAQLMKKETGAAHAIVIHHQVRNASISNGSSVGAYASGIHSDSCTNHANEIFKNIVKGMESKFKTGRFLYVNAWRNISETPIEDNHLAMLDERTTIKPDDYMIADLYTATAKDQQYKLRPNNHEKHEWWYFSAMKKNEVILFKQYDSDPALNGRACFHTAFQNNALRNVTPQPAARQSIEARVFCFFPDHQPNTCPTIDNLDQFKGSQDPAAQCVAKIILIVNYIAGNHWPPASVTYVRSLLKKGGNHPEVRGFATSMVEDKDKKHGTHDYLPIIKKAAVELLLKENLLFKACLENIKTLDKQ